MSTQLAVLLAHEKAEGEDSFYHPYIAVLPKQAPCAWAMSDSQLEDALEKISAEKSGLDECPSTEELESWRIEARNTRESLRGHSEALHERYKAVFRPEVYPAKTTATENKLTQHDRCYHHHHHVSEKCDIVLCCIGDS